MGFDATPKRTHFKLKSENTEAEKNKDVKHWNNLNLRFNLLWICQN